MRRATLTSTKATSCRAAALASAVILAAILLAVVGTKPAKATFPGQNGKIVFDSNRGGTYQQVYAMNPDGTGLTNLTKNTSWNDAEAQVSPDGTKVVFASDRANPGGKPDIYVMNADGSNQIPLATDPATDKQPAWSPDGNQIVFVSDRSGSEEIYKMNADGSGLTQLTNNPNADRFPSWSPDGSKIAWTRCINKFFGGCQYEIYVMNSDGSNPLNLTNNSADDYTPNWSPDGTKIAFTRDGGNSVLDEPGAEIYVMPATGSNQATRLTTNRAADDGPAFSPDGSKIVFNSKRTGNWEIFVMNSDGTNQTNRTNNPALDEDPDWGVAPKSG